MVTSVRLPPSLLYPIEIVELYVAPGDAISHHEKMIKFKYWSRVPDGVPEDGEEPEYVNKEFYGTFESPYDGAIESIFVKLGDRINDELTTVLSIAETCDHSVQYGGLCALCGRSLDDKDYTGFSDVDRAPIAMSHDTAGLTVSRLEAEQIETRSTQRLLSEKRLILVVDLDQTVIHASVNPEIGQWISDPESAHHDQVKDVRSFALKEKVGHQEQVGWYYVKIRPGVADFLKEMASKYEMHIYTMATRQYALEIARIIDPDGTYFGDRILSRDASGSLLQKDLKRLFPVSTKMVTIIDDRGDVWSWSPNLLRVVPYHFWSNTGDINSQFLPKRSGLVTPDQVADSDEQIASLNDDTEMHSVGKALSALHTEFFERYNPASLGDPLPDVGKLLPSLKSEVFDGCVLLFSGFFPLGTTDLDSADIVQWVRSFGAVVLADFLPSVTHIVARDAGTTKARQGAGHKKMVVRIDWVFQSLEKWQHLDEDSFLLDVPNPILPKKDDKAENPRDEEIDPNTAGFFMRSLQRGDLNWNDIDEELQEVLGDDDDDDEEDDSRDDYNDESKDESKEEAKEESKPELNDSSSDLKTESNEVVDLKDIEKSLKRKREEEEVVEANEDDLGLDSDWD